LSAEVRIPANAAHEYWVAIYVNGVGLRAQIDTGMTQPTCEVGLGLAPADFDQLVSSLRQPGLVEQHVGGPVPILAPTGLAYVSIDGLDNSEIETRIVRLPDNLLGVCYFHRLMGFELHWDFASRTMVIRRSQ
jgi:predicted aspartyl protease